MYSTGIWTLRIILRNVLLINEYSTPWPKHVTITLNHIVFERSLINPSFICTQQKWNDEISTFQFQTLEKISGQSVAKSKGPISSPNLVPS